MASHLFASVICGLLRHTTTNSGIVTRKCKKHNFSELSQYVYEFKEGKGIYYTLFHDLFSRSYVYHSVWSLITANNFTPAKYDEFSAMFTEHCRANTIADNFWFLPRSDVRFNVILLLLRLFYCVTMLLHSF